MKIDTKKININIKKDILKEFDRKAQNLGLTRTALIIILINNYLYKN